MKYLERDSQWLIQDAHHASIAWFFEEADARAFVALPALVKYGKKLADLVCREGEMNGLTSEESNALTKFEAALAQADGPSQEQG